MDDEYTISGYGTVKKTLRRCWINCAREPDDDILAIDAQEDAIAPLDEATIHIRQLITSLECCHHKTERHIQIIIEAIGNGSTTKGQGRPDTERLSPREREYQAVIACLTCWQTGAALTHDVRFGEHTGSELYALLGGPTPVKIWQVQRVVEKLERFLDRRQRWNAAYENVIDTRHDGIEAEFRDVTMQTVIYDTEDGQPAEITLALAIDYLTGCNWDFPETLTTIIAAIGGQTHARRPLALHARNLHRNPARERMQGICRSLGIFVVGQQPSPADHDIVCILGTPTPIKRWLAASLAKTIRLQMKL